MQIDTEKVLALLQSNGPIAQQLKGFESRPEQTEMMRAVLEAYNQKEIALIEAGTGTGKSMAYLIPALLWAVQNKERTVISTNTIALQEQLLHKDIPLLIKALGVDLKAVLVKGMGNYLCKRKLEDCQYELRLMNDQETWEMETIVKWDQTTRDGTRASLPMYPSAHVWEKVCAESDTCNGKNCSFYEECHFVRARREAEDAQILIVNHSLLFADLALKTSDSESEMPQGILPAYSRVVLDEAHEVEEIATQFFAGKASRNQMMKHMGRIGNEKLGKLPTLGKMINQYVKEIPKEALLDIVNRISIDIPGLRQKLQQQIVDVFHAFEEFLVSVGSAQTEEKQRKIRLMPHYQQHPLWKEEIVPAVELLVFAVESYYSALQQLSDKIQILDNEKLEKQTQGTRHEILSLGNRLIDASKVLKDFIRQEPDTSTVRWMETDFIHHQPNTSLIDAPLDISEKLAVSLFGPLPTVILCSATLTTNKNFHFVRSRLGLNRESLPFRKVKEYLFASPFDFQKQALLAIPVDIPNPTDSAYLESVTEMIWEAIQASRGNAFVLFTSYLMMRQCFDRLQERLKKHRFTPFKQGDDNRKSLLDRFKSTDYSVLFGTDSFWQGIDVAGEALRCVILAKLPFKVPSEPIIQARTEAIEKAGGDAFMDYSIPTAIVKFKQGFGRLIRNKKDRGCIVCLDPRIVRKPYGKLFLNSLPPCEKIFPEGGTLKEKMSEFYRKTYHLTK